MKNLSLKNYHFWYNQNEPKIATIHAFWKKIYEELLKNGLKEDNIENTYFHSNPEYFSFKYKLKNSNFEWLSVVFSKFYDESKISNFRTCDWKIKTQWREIIRDTYKNYNNVLDELFKIIEKDNQGSENFNY